MTTNDAAPAANDVVTEFGLARLLRDVRTAGAEPTHRFPDIERLYDELLEDDRPAPAPQGVVLQFPGSPQR